MIDVHIFNYDYTLLTLKYTHTGMRSCVYCIHKNYIIHEYNILYYFGRTRMDRTARRMGGIIIIYNDILYCVHVPISNTI